jgi:hypothetical protein
MASYTAVQELFVVRTFYSPGGSFVAVERQCRREFYVRVAPSGDTVCWIIKRSEETRVVCVKHEKGRK